MATPLRFFAAWWFVLSLATSFVLQVLDVHYFYDDFLWLITSGIVGAPLLYRYAQPETTAPTDEKTEEVTLNRP